MSQLPTCVECGLPKKPIGRDASPAQAGSLCDTDCPGYSKPPFAGKLWPEEGADYASASLSEPGIYFNISREDYDALTHVNKSSLFEFWKNPRTFALKKPKAPTDQMKWGVLFEQVLLEPIERQLNGFAILTEKTKLELLQKAQERQGKKASKKFSKNLLEYRAWLAEHEEAGHTIITGWTFAQAQKAVKAIWSEPSISGILQAQHNHQAVIVWQDPDTGLTCKGLVDLAVEGDRCLTDIKTTASIVTTSREAAPWKFIRTAVDLGYHWQAAMYLDGWRLAQEQSGQRIEDFERTGWRFVVSGANATSLDSVEPPYPAAGWMLPTPYVEAGRKAYKQALCEWQACRETNHFPGLTTDSEFPDLPLLKQYNHQ